MFFHVQGLINEIVPDEPDPLAANALQEGLGGQFGEMRTMMQYLFQSFNARGDAPPFKDLIQGIGVEEISHVELMATTITHLLDGSARYQGRSAPKAKGSPGAQPTAKGKGSLRGASSSRNRSMGASRHKARSPLRSKSRDGGDGRGGDLPGAGGATPLKVALTAPNIHHFLVGAQCALPVDAAGNPWSGSYVYASGNLVLDLLYNVMLEATGRLQKCRIYEMTDNKTARATISYLIARDQAHQLAFAKALETLGINWGKTLPIPKFDSTKYPEVKKLMDKGAHLKQHHFRLDGSEMGRIFQGSSPAGDGETLQMTEEAPEGFPVADLPERAEEFAPGLTPELMELVEAAAGIEHAALRR